jgi:hypothetical protein
MEQVRRAMTAGGVMLGWGAKAASSSDPMGDISKDLKKLTKNGAALLKQEVADELEGKKTEMSKLEDLIIEFRALAADEGTTYPRDLTYVHTARDAARGLVTKTEVVPVNDAAENESAANKMEKGLNRWTQYKDQMIEALNLKNQLLNTVTNELNDFVEFSQGLLAEVIVTLH